MIPLQEGALRSPTAWTNSTPDLAWCLSANPVEHTVESLGSLAVPVQVSSADTGDSAKCSVKRTGQKAQNKTRPPPQHCQECREETVETEGET